MKVVKFVRNAPPYMAGEFAGFPDREAEKLIGQGAAVAHKTESEDATSEGAQQANKPSEPTLPKPARKPR